ncbi:calcium-binding protein, partial [Pseudomonas sp. 79_C]|uniref:calcium-binding protein n=1 Tax=Pseudomonas sp. 79_C TaxID=2813567 RepID=UPI002435BAF3
LGADAMTGGGGNDTFVVDNVGDTVSEALNGGVDLVQTSLASYTLGANVENLTYTGVGNFIGGGNALDNVITGGGGNDRLNGGAGADRLVGGLGNDTYVVDNVGDLVFEDAGAGTDDVRTTLANYVLRSNVENLTYIGVGNFIGGGNALDNVITG